MLGLTQFAFFVSLIACSTSLSIVPLVRERGKGETGWPSNGSDTGYNSSVSTTAPVVARGTGETGWPTNGGEEDRRWRAAVSSDSVMARVVDRGTGETGWPSNGGSGGSPRRDAGPSGSVIAPVGGTTIANTQLGAGGLGRIHFQYQRANTTYEGYPISTLSVDLVMVDPAGTQTPVPVARGLEATPPYADTIETYFMPAVCGQWELRVLENQFWNVTGLPQIFSFQSAAPTINVDCTPL